MNLAIEFNSIKHKWDTNFWEMYSKSSCDYGGWKKLLKNINIKRHLSMPFHLGMGYINSNLELSCVWKLMELKVVLPKPILMSNHH